MNTDSPDLSAVYSLVYFLSSESSRNSNSTEGYLASKPVMSDMIPSNNREQPAPQFNRKGRVE